MQYDRDMDYLARYYDREFQAALKLREERENSRKSSHSKREREMRKASNPADKYLEMYNQLPKEKLKSVLKNSAKLKNQGVVVRQSYGGEKLQNKIKELDRLMKECELKEQQRLAEKKIREDLHKETLEEKRNRKTSQYYLKLLGEHGDITVDDMIRARDERRDSFSRFQTGDGELEASEIESEFSDDIDPQTVVPTRRKSTSVGLRGDNGGIVVQQEDLEREKLERRQRKKEWKQARSARYIRTKKPRDFEVELKIEQIFPG